MRVQVYPIETPPRSWFWTCGVGHYVVDEKYGHANPKGYEKRHCLFLTVGGKGAYRWKNRSFADEPGALTLMTDVGSHMNWGAAHQKWDFYWMLFKGDGPLNWAKQFNVSLPLFASSISKERMPDLISRFENFIKMGAADSFDHNKMALQRAGFLLYASIIEAVQDAETISQIPSIYGKNLLEEIDKYLLRRDPTPDRLDELAEKIHASPEHISRVLKASIGISPKEYFLRFRVRQAQRLLRSTVLSVGEIGARVGYTDPQHFSKLFHAKTGISALNYRKSRLGL